MKRNFVLHALAVAALLAVCASIAGTAAAAPVSQHVTLTGYITCTSCMEPNTCKAQTRASCTQWWVSQGASYVLVVGDSHYTLSGAEKELAKAAFENTVTVSGELNGNTVEVSNVDFSHKAK
jgi:hypothetical protein